MDSKLGFQGPAVLIEQHIRQPQLLVFRHSFTDNTISALPLLRVPCPPSPLPRLSCYFLFSGSSLVGVHSPQDVVIGSLQLQRQGGSQKASCLIPLLPCKGFNTSPTIHIRGSILKGNLRMYPTCQPSALGWPGCKVGSEDLTGSMTSRKKCSSTQKHQWLPVPYGVRTLPTSAIQGPSLSLTFAKPWQFIT